MIIPRPCVICGRKTLDPVLVAFEAIDGVARICVGCAEATASELGRHAAAKRRQLERRSELEAREREKHAAAKRRRMKRRRELEAARKKNRRTR